MPKIKVELEINDKLWADFCLCLEEHKDCCDLTTNFILSRLITNEVINYKIEEMTRRYIDTNKEILIIPEAEIIRQRCKIDYTEE